jgi:nucleotide-binding universal stress UspA family protein
MILMSYDGSADAQTAIDHAAKLMPGAEATVLTVWEPLLDAMTRGSSFGMGFGWSGAFSDTDAVDAANEQAALINATEGAERAVTAGLVAQPRIARQMGGIAQAVLAAAAEVDADLVVLGTRGLGGVKSFLLGSVSHEVVQHADRPVLVVPSAGVAERRRAWTDKAELSASA